MCTSVVEQQRKIAAEKLRSAIAETLVDDSAIIELERKQQSKHKELKSAIDFAPLLPSFRSIYSIPPPPLPFRLAAYLPPPSLRFRPSTPFRQQQLPPLLPFRIVYSREFILRCAASPHSTLPPKNMPELLLSYNEIVVKFPRRFPSHDWLLVRWVDDNKNTNKKKKGNNNGQQQQKTMMMGKPWHLLMMMVNSNNQFLHGLI